MRVLLIFHENVPFVESIHIFRYVHVNIAFIL